MSTEGSPIIQETIQLDVKLSQDKGLAALVAQLEQVKRAAQQADAALAKTTGTKPTLNAKGLEDEIKKLQKGVGGKPLALTLPDLSKAFDVHLGQWREFIGKNKEWQKEFKSLQAETLRSAPAASRLLYAFQEHQARGGRRTWRGSRRRRWRRCMPRRWEWTAPRSSLSCRRPSRSSR